MGLILSEPIETVVEVPKVLIKTFVSAEGLWETPLGTSGSTLGRRPAARQMPHFCARQPVALGGSRAFVLGGSVGMPLGRPKRSLASPLLGKSTTSALGTRPHWGAREFLGDAAWDAWERADCGPPAAR